MVVNTFLLQFSAKRSRDLESDFLVYWILFFEKLENFIITSFSYSLGTIAYASRISIQNRGSLAGGSERSIRIPKVPSSSLVRVGIYLEAKPGRLEIIDADKFV